MTDDLVTWLCTQLNAVELDARNAADGFGYVRYIGELGEQDWKHIAHWDPPRVLVEISAMRRIIELHTPTDDGEWLWCPADVIVDPNSTVRLPGDVGRWYRAAWPCLTVRLIALPFADRAGYRDEWRP